MPAPQPIRKQSFEQLHALVRAAIQSKKPIRASYLGHVRLLCPHRLGWNKEGRQNVLCYQYGGESSTGLKPPGSPDNWRCVALQKLTDIELVEDPWSTAQNHSRAQTCIEKVEVDAEDF